jgi:hypothetical protein
MINENQSFEVKTQIKTSRWNWIVGIFFIIVGLGGLTVSVVSGAVSLLVGLAFLPPVARKIMNKYGYSLSRKMKIALIVIVLLVIGMFSSGDKKIEVVTDTPISVAVSKVPEQKAIPKPVEKTNPTISATTSSTSKAEATKELDEIMALGKKAGLITSYEFSSTANVVYVGKIWYTQDVTFKKDLLTKISILKETITGYHRFEVRDTYSNEKVAEVTAFTGSIEIYK